MATLMNEGSRCGGDPDPGRPARGVATGAVAGAAVGATAVVTAVPVIQAVGFTASGIAAGSAAAGMMSSAATAAGGSIASGSAVATLQSIGALGVLPVEISVPVVLGAAVAGMVVPTIIKCFRSGQREYQSAYEHCDAAERVWVVATEEGWGNVRVCRYDSEEQAREAFDKIWCSRILFNPDRREVQAAGMPLVHGTIRRVMEQHYFG
jgi:hypothetical protein